MCYNTVVEFDCQKTNLRMLSMMARVHLRIWLLQIDAGILTPRLSVVLMSLFFAYISLSVLFDTEVIPLYERIV